MIKLFLKSFIYSGLTSLALFCLKGLIKTSSVTYPPGSNISQLEVLTIMFIPVVIWLCMTLYILAKTDYKELTLQKILTIFFGLILYSVALFILLYTQMPGLFN